MVCLSCMQKKSGRISKKKDINSNYMSYKWAIPTWDFFHSFAEKINPNFYIKQRTACIKIVTDLGRTLPCQQCQTHANAFLTSRRLKAATTKQKFIQLLLDFHNDVNKRTGKPLLTLANLNKYKNSNYINITRVFLAVFSSYKSTMHGGISERRARMHALYYIRQWINAHHKNFA